MSKKQKKKKHMFKMILSLGIKIDWAYQNFQKVKKLKPNEFIEIEDQLEGIDEEFSALLIQFDLNYFLIPGYCKKHLVNFKKSKLKPNNNDIEVIQEILEDSSLKFLYYLYENDTKLIKNYI